MAINLGTIRAVLVSDSSQLKKDLDSVDRKLERFLRVVNGVTDSMLKFGFSILKTGIEGADEFDKVQISLEAMTESVEEATELMKEMQNFALATPFNLKTLNDSAVRLKSIGVETDALIPTLKVFGDQVATAGGNSQTFDRILLAFAQMRSKGKVMTQEMNQFAESGVAVWGLLAEAMGGTVADARREVENGGVSASMVLEPMIRHMVATSEGSMERMANTFSGRLEGMKEAAKMQLATVMAPLKESLKDLFPVITELGFAFGGFLKPLLEGMVYLVRQGTAVLGIFSKLPAAWQQATFAAIALAGAAFLAVTAFTALFFVVSATFSAFAGMFSVIGAIGLPFFMFLSVAIIELVALFTAVTAAFILFANAYLTGNETIVAITDTTIKAVVWGWENIAKRIGEIVNKVLTGMAKAIAKMAELWLGMMATIYDGFAKIGLTEKIRNDAKAAAAEFRKYQQMVNDQRDEVAKSGFAEYVFEGMKSAGNTLIDEAKAFFNGPMKTVFAKMLPEEVDTAIKDWLATVGGSATAKMTAEEIDKLVASLLAGMGDLTPTPKNGDAEIDVAGPFDIWLQLLFDELDWALRTADLESALAPLDGFAEELTAMGKEWETMLNEAAELAKEAAEKAEAARKALPAKVGEMVGFNPELMGMGKEAAEFSAMMKTAGGSLAGLAGPLGIVVGILIQLIGKTKTFAYLNERISQLIGSVVKILNKLIKPLQPLINVVFNIAEALLGLLEPMIMLTSPLGLILSVMDELGAALVPLLNVIKGVVSVFTEGTGPMKFVMDLLSTAMEGIFYVFKGVGFIMLAIAMAIGWVWNAVSDAIIAVLDVLEEIPGLGKILGDAKKSMENGKVDMDALGDQWDALNDLTWEQAQAAAAVTDENDKLKESIKEVNEELINIPEGFKTALYRYQEQQSVFSPQTSSGARGGLAIPAMASGGIVTSPTIALIGEAGPEAVVPLSDGAGYGTTIIVQNLTVHANDMMELESALRKVGEQKRFQSSGITTSTRKGRFSTT